VKRGCSHLIAIARVQERPYNNQNTTKEGNKKTMREYRKWQCIVCGFVYDEEEGLPEEGIAPGTRWEEIGADWTCPDCGVSKSEFEMVVMA
jgi:rubredoxin